MLAETRDSLEIACSKLQTSDSQLEAVHPSPMLAPPLIGAKWVGGQWTERGWQKQRLSSWISAFYFDPQRNMLVVF